MGLLPLFVIVSILVLHVGSSRIVRRVARRFQDELVAAFDSMEVVGALALLVCPPIGIPVYLAWFARNDHLLLEALDEAREHLLLIHSISNQTPSSEVSAMPDAPSADEDPER